MDRLEELRAALCDRLGHDQAQAIFMAVFAQEAFAAGKEQGLAPWDELPTVPQAVIEERFAELVALPDDELRSVSVKANAGMRSVVEHLKAEGN